MSRKAKYHKQKTNLNYPQLPNCFFQCLWYLQNITMGTDKEKILTIIQQNSLPFEELSLWEEIVNHIPDKLHPDVLWFLENIPNGVSILTNKIKENMAAIENGDVAKWEAILQKDTEFLKSLES